MTNSTQAWFGDLSVLFKVSDCCTTGSLGVTLEDGGEGIPPSRWHCEQYTCWFTLSGDIKVLMYEYTVTPGQRRGVDQGSKRSTIRDKKGLWGMGTKHVNGCMEKALRLILLLTKDHASRSSTHQPERQADSPVDVSEAASFRGRPCAMQWTYRQTSHLSRMEIKHRLRSLGSSLRLI